ncbi:sodium:neurotransmitter symporter [Thermanaerovibrio acidaminovorans DSM 6589]|uniref:Transporter n=1 Tax=Thermanaerovibrio acidaminovorans (strain ATCC 49978 / DSM 6589 / Su883) TaxID=525903 RepID=D1B8L5_THEAS|nr:sodium-dependent transporter [Thermanaerovibrio acidaminovorans]ACZ18618.1 sodium:neurotransmitter symporter [Thermanaerovibrio acidaminovorans DSM 6589]
MSDGKKREGFSSGLAVFFATLGSAVGLGNIWKFPYLTGVNGGGAFLLVYFICIALVGIPVMTGEFIIGRRGRGNAVGSFRNVTGNPATPWRFVGVLGVLSAYLIMFFYTDVAGWVYFYFFKAATGQLAGITKEQVGPLFKAVVGAGATSLRGAMSPVLWQWIVLALVGSAISLGVRSGIERITKTLMPLLFVLIILCDIRALTLPGAKDGIRFLFNVDFSKLTPSVILAALGLAFFKLSLGMSTMITYGSYFTDDNRLINTAVRVAASDTLVSLLAGLAIFPTVFSFGMEPSAGPGLLFMTIPLVFSQIPLGNLLLAAFFLLTCFAATTAMLSIMEVPIAFMVEELKLKRPLAALLNCIIIGSIGATATLSADGSSYLGGIHILGRTFFDLYDHLSSNIMMPIGGLLTAVFVGYVLKSGIVEEQLSNGGTLNNRGLIAAYRFVLRYITPALLLLVFLSTAGVIRL